MIRPTTFSLCSAQILWCSWRAKQLAGVQPMYICQVCRLPTCLSDALCCGLRFPIASRATRQPAFRWIPSYPPCSTIIDRPGLLRFSDAYRYPSTREWYCAVCMCTALRTAGMTVLFAYALNFALLTLFVRAVKWPACNWMSSMSIRRCIVFTAAVHVSCGGGG
jgi:hypothetical protein